LYLQGPHWWLEFRGGSVLSVRFRSLSGEAIDDVVVLFSVMSLNPAELNDSGVIFNQREETLPKVSVLHGPFWRPLLIVPTPPDMPALVETLLNVGAISHYLDRAGDPLERLTHCGQFHPIVCRLQGPSDELFRTAVPFDQRRPSAPARDALGVTTAVRPYTRLHWSQYSSARAVSLERHSRAVTASPARLRIVREESRA
jgi:hypothetical protein